MAESENRVSSCIGSSFELEGDLRCFGKPITVFFHVVSVAGRDYGFLRCLSDLDPGLFALCTHRSQGARGKPAWRAKVISGSFAFRKSRRERLKAYGLRAARL